MPQDYWYNSSYSGTKSAFGLGFIGYVMQQYQTTPAVYTMTDIASYTNQYYCVSSDGVSNFTFYNNGSSPTCTAPLSGSPTYTMAMALPPMGSAKVGYSEWRGDPERRSARRCTP